LIWVVTELTPRTALSQEIPTLVKAGLDLAQTHLFFRAQPTVFRRTLIQTVLFVDKLVDAREHLCVVHDPPPDVDD
jgi:hypothetical protein